MKVYLAGTGLWVYLTPILGGVSLIMKIFLVHEANKSGLFGWVAPALVGGAVSLTGSRIFSNRSTMPTKTKYRS